MITSYYKKLKEGLEQFPWSIQPKIEPSPSNTQPLFLLLTVKPNVVGFAALDGHPEENFAKGFQNFKELYSIRSGEWGDFDLTLVLCKSDGKEASDEFCNRIQLDPYFCRKCVIDLSKNVKGELGGLPFIPLSPEGVVGFKRPVSAQTFLMKHHVNTQLARYLVVPHAKGKENIAAECIDGHLGKPEWPEMETKEFIIPQYEGAVEVRLKKLEIRNFRAYRGTHEFDLDANLIVLYGPNGLGKTSFFDSMDFAYTGGVARFDERLGRHTQRLIGALKHLDSKLDDSLVKATIFANGKDVYLERSLKDRTRAVVDGNIQERSKVLFLLTGLLEEPPDVRIENLIQLFRSTHLFGQEYQSLTAGFREQSKLPGQIVSRMLAFQDYVEAVNKSSLVCEEFTRKIKACQENQAVLKEFLDSKKQEMEQFRATVKRIEIPQNLLALGEEIAGRIAGETNLSGSVQRTFNKEVVREWRGILASEISATKRRLELMEDLEAKLPQIGNLKATLENNLGKMKERQTLIDITKGQYIEKAEILRQSDEIIRKMLLEEREFSLKVESLSWLVKARGECDQLNRQLLEEEERYRSCHAVQLDILAKGEKLKSEIESVNTYVNKKANEVRALENDLKEIDDVEKEIDDWLKEMGREKDLGEEFLAFEQKLILRNKELGIKKEEFNASTILCERLRKRINSLQRSQSELLTLLDSIEKHVSTNVCPVCGTAHKSREFLIEKLKVQKGYQPPELQEGLISYQGEKAKYDQLEKDVSVLDLEIKQLERKSAKIQNERLENKRILERYGERAIKLDIPITGEDLRSPISSRKQKILEEVNLRQQELSEKKLRGGKLEEEMSSLLRQKASVEEELGGRGGMLKRLRSMIERIGSDATVRKVSLELGKEQIEHELKKVGSAMANLSKKIQIHQIENERLKREVDSLIEKRDIVEGEVEELEKIIFHLRKRIEEFGNLLERSNLGADVDTHKVRSLKENAIGKLSRLDSLHNRVINFEIALDATEVSAALAKIQQDIERAERQLREAENEERLLGGWLSYFKIICKRLELLQNQALKEYTDKYGPLTSTIQRRLRSVYGFGEMSLHPENGGIAVRVERKGEKNIFPSDYFSESQIQIAMLSLFLSAALTQTWSSFAPILLDDPVEHFDDLNAYSLLDLIRGLITEPGKSHQFIISTCEERLYRLMRQKFSKMNCKVIFYVFESIGDNGPRISKSYC